MIAPDGEASLSGAILFSGGDEIVDEVHAVTLWEVINVARDEYLHTYRETFRAQREKMQGLTAETLVAVNGAHDVPEDYRFFRADLLWRDQGQPRLGTIGARDARLPAPIETQYPDGGRVTIAAFRWDDCVIAATPILSNEAPLRLWLGQWIDRHDRNAMDSDGLRGAVHSMTPPQLSPDGSATLLAVDFGSAAPEAFTKLISALFACGATSITIGDVSRYGKPRLVV